MNNKAMLFAEVSFVSTDMPILSKWQASFAQIFPIGYADLPSTHESDKAFFEARWKGPKMSYEEFLNLIRKP